MRIFLRGLNLFFLIILTAGNFTRVLEVPVPKAFVPAASLSAWQSKVDAWVTESASAGDTEFIIFLSEQADLRGAAGLETKPQKGNYVYQHLTEVARHTQGPLVAALKAQGSEYRPYWVANMIWARGGLSLVQSIAMRSDVAHVYANPWVRLQAERPVSTQTRLPNQPQTIEWNILKVNAEEVWAAGYTGQGAVIGGQDTGYAWQHPALIRQYRGWNGAIADHNYNWHDAIHSGGGSCGPDSSQPCDDYGHGTHTMGTMVGDDGLGNQIGMAPGARWIGCRNMNVGVGSPATYAECYQWFIAPTDLNDENPRPDLAPDVINNSWSCPLSEGCTDPNVLLAVVNNVRAAGILTAHSAGNNGYNGCSSISDPAAIYSASFTVGATDSSDTIASFSSRGPVTVDGSNRLKPDISAPGVNVRSSLSYGGYGIMSGTSMAAPHVAGLVALLISASPSLRGQVDVLEGLIKSSALPRITTQNCGGVLGTSVPNNTYGWGRIDAFAAFQAARQRNGLWIGKTASAGHVAPGELLTYTLSVTNTNYVLPAHGLILTDTLPLGTSFVSSSTPFVLSNNKVVWQRTQLDPGGVWRVLLTVAVAKDDSSWSVINNDYASRSDEVVQPVHGEPLIIPTRVVYHFPFIIYNQPFR